MCIRDRDWDPPYTLDQILQVKQGKPLPKNPKPDVIGGRELYEDDWCPTCRGCRSMECNECGGKRLKPARPVWGVRHVYPNGKKLEGWIKQPPVECKNCLGAGEVKCNCCKNGKIP